MTNTALTEALSFKRYPMALRLARLGELTDAEMRSLVSHLERSPYDASHPWNTARDALIALVRERGVAIDPQPVSPDRDGTAPRCVHSPRDLFDGSEPSVCREPDR